MSSRHWYNKVTKPGLRCNSHQQAEQYGETEVADFLTIIRNLSLKTDTVSEYWRIAKSCQSFKKRKGDPGNYRSVRLISVPAKMVESLIKNLKKKS